MEKNHQNHQLMGGDVQLFKRPNSQFWYCQASVGGRRHRLSTKRESLAQAEDVAKDWFLTLQGKARAGLLLTEKTFAEVAEKFRAELFVNAGACGWYCYRLWRGDFPRAYRADP